MIFHDLPMIFHAMSTWPFPPGALQEVSFAIGKPVSAVKAASDLLALERKRGTKEGIARALLLVTLAVLTLWLIYG